MDSPSKNTRSSLVKSSSGLENRLKKTAPVEFKNTARNDTSKRAETLFYCDPDKPYHKQASYAAINRTLKNANKTCGDTKDLDSDENYKLIPQDPDVALELKKLRKLAKTRKNKIKKRPKSKRSQSKNKDDVNDADDNMIETSDDEKSSDQSWQGKKEAK